MSDNNLDVKLLSVEMLKSLEGFWGISSKRKRFFMLTFKWTYLQCLENWFCQRVTNCSVGYFLRRFQILKSKIKKSCKMSFTLSELILDMMWLANNWSKQKNKTKQKNGLYSNSDRCRFHLRNKSETWW